MQKFRIPLKNSFYTVTIDCVRQLAKKLKSNNVDNIKIGTHVMKKILSVNEKEKLGPKFDRFYIVTNIKTKSAHEVKSSGNQRYLINRKDSITIEDFEEDPETDFKRIGV